MAPIHLERRVAFIQNPTEGHETFEPSSQTEIIIVGPLTVIAASLLALLPTFVVASDLPKQACGTNSSTAIRQAAEAIARNKPDEDHAALICLLHAVELLDSGQAIVRRGEDHHPMIHAPTLPGKAGRP